MNRPVWGMLLLMSVMVAASGCGSDKSEPGAKADPASGSNSPAAGAEAGSSQFTFRSRVTRSAASINADR